MLRLIENEEEVQTEVRSVLDNIVREGARKMLITALQCEVDEYVSRYEGEKDDENRRLVTRHGKAQKRTILTGAGPLEIEMPRVRDRRENEKFLSKILPPYIPQGDFPSERAKIAKCRGGYSGVVSSRFIDRGFF